MATEVISEQQQTSVGAMPGSKRYVLRARAHGRARQSADGRPPQLADGVELIGEFEGSGFKNPPMIARRPDGQTVQMPALLYAIAEQIDGKRSYEEIAEAAGAASGRELHRDDVELVVEEKLCPLGLIDVCKIGSPEFKKIDPLLALRFRVSVVHPEMVRRITSPFRVFFFPPVIVAALASLVATDVWLFGYHGVAQSVHQTLYHPSLLLVLLGMVIVSAAFHEFGHAVACTYGGATPGVMGAGIYIAWPAFYTDVTDAYRLDKRGRLRTDLGGIYFNGVFILATMGA